LPALYGSETWFLILKEKHGFRVFEIEELRKIWTSERRHMKTIEKLHKEYFHKLHLSPNYEGWNFNSGKYLFTTDTK